MSDHLRQFDTPERNQVLDNLFRSYRDAIPGTEPSAGFSPALWQKIEAADTVWAGFRRLAPAFVTAAAALCLLAGFLLVAPHRASASRLSYVEVLAADHSPDTPEYAEAVFVENEGDRNPR